MNGEVLKAKKAIEHFNTACYAGGSIYLYDDVTLAEKGIAVRPIYNHRGTFSISLQCTNQGSEKARVLVPPGATVRAPGHFQDATVLNYRMLKAEPNKWGFDRSLVACCEFGDKDPRASSPSGFESHKNKDVSKVATAATRLGASWETAQVAIWAVTDNPTLEALLTTPGNYRKRNVRAARSVLKSAGLKASNYQLWGQQINIGELPSFDVVRGIFGG